MAKTNTEALVKDAIGQKTRPGTRIIPKPSRAIFTGIIAMLLGICVVIITHMLHNSNNSWFTWAIEALGLGLVTGGATYGYARHLRSLSAGLEKETSERRRAESIMLLQRDLAVMMGLARDVQSALERLLDIGFLIEGVDCGGIYLFDDATGGLRLVAHRGLSKGFVQAKSYYSADDPHTTMVKSGKTLIIEHQHLCSLMHDPDIPGEGLKAVAVIPMLSEGRVVACLNLASRSRDHFSEGIAEVFQVVASLLTGVIERKRSENALRQSEERFRTMSEFTHDLEYWVGADGRMVYISPSCERLTGYTRAEFQANPNLMDLIMHPDDRALLVGHRVGRPDRSSCKAEFRILTRSGDVRWVAHVCVPVNSADGQFLGRRASNRDVTERILAEQTLRQERNLFMSGPVVVFKWKNDEHWSEEYVSPNINQFGYTPDDFYTQSRGDLDITHPDDRERVEAETRLYLATDAPTYEQEYRVLRADGEERWVHDVTQVVRNDAGAITHFHGYLLDITERKRAEEKLRDNEQRFRVLAQEREQLFEQARHDAQIKATLLQEVNHRVKNNLSSIIGLLRTEERFARIEARDPAVRFKDMADRISGLATVHALLSAAEWGPIPLDKLIRHITYATLRLAPNDKHADVHVTPSSILVDASEANSLALIFNELSMNAIKHGLKDNRHLSLAVTIHSDLDNVILELRNKGPGFPEPVLQGKARGMGLYLVETLIRHDLGGKLNLRNEDGPVVIMRLPKKQTKETTSEHKQQRNVI